MWFTTSGKWAYALWEGRILNSSIFSINGPFSVCYILKTDAWNDVFQYAYQNSASYMLFLSPNCSERGILIFSILTSRRDMDLPGIVLESTTTNYW
ncbi:hypothetical protein RSOLAG1IB_08614 [Rhizoctonia solani AG-1 IB]|uniref:Uncharacterized protein n=1 Tax=Thanatephorus cucumeris (strain AG1-IB / isolate 7/3/14) TaxID=1108050 RepID=A0A0B7FQN1_THACB|nr:hypothetical protein RSOLAG1IB_08614 [Rhizoctonia solani AG-1 IB]